VTGPTARRVARLVPTCPTVDDVPDAQDTAGTPGQDAGTPGQDQAEGPVVRPLDAPRDGVPDVVDTPDALAACITLLGSGHGPVAVDAERASGHRYGQRAFLVQLRRDGAGTVLVDPAALPDLSELGRSLSGLEWVLHAASQDLPCLAEVGMVPDLLFDTELGGRLAGYPRVGLAAMVEELLGLRLAKEHSAVDWSTRPLPEPWLRYAALDVEVLVELRDALAAELAEQGKLEWATEEFAAVLAAPPPPPRTDPWRRTSGLHRIRDRRKLAAVRELWSTRDELARTRDVSPGRVLPDSSIVEAALAGPHSAAELTALPGFSGRGARRYAREWYAALTRAQALPATDLPAQTVASDGPPPIRVWSDRDPAAAARLTAARSALGAIAEQHRLPVENLVSPDTVRRLAWEPPNPVDPVTVEAGLRRYGARSWQIGLAVDPLTVALTATRRPGEATGPAEQVEPSDA
jgi:ribonuclease D